MDKLLGEAQPQIDVGARRSAAVAVRHTAVPGSVVPAATTDHAIRATGRAGGIFLCCTAIRTIPILTPFIYVARHVIKAEFIGQLLRNGVCLAA